jgi:hypothetical protein
MAVKTTDQWLLDTMYQNGDIADDVTLSKPVKQVKQELNYTDGYMAVFRDLTPESYSGATYYTVNHIVSYLSINYVSLQDNNQGQAPNVSPTFWRVITAADSETIFIKKSLLAVPQGVATLDANGKLLTSQVPNLSITKSFVVATEVAMLALTVQEGDVAIRADLNKNFIANGTDSSLISGWNEMASTPNAPVFTVNTYTGDVVLSTSDILDTLDKRYVTDIDLTHLNSLVADLSGKEPTFSKNSAFNKNFDSTTTATYTPGIGTDVSRSDHGHIASNQTVLDGTTASYTTAEETKLSGIAPLAEVNVQSDWNQTTNTLDDYIKNKPVNVTITVDGFMSAGDKVRLDGMADSANNYSLPIADTGVLGGVLDGTDITIDASGNVSVNDDSHAHTISTITDIGTASVAYATDAGTLDTLDSTQFLRSDADDTGTNLTLTSLTTPTITGATTLTLNTGTGIGILPGLSIDAAQEVKAYAGLNLVGTLRFDNGTQGFYKVAEQFVWTSTNGTTSIGAKDATSTYFDTSLSEFKFNKKLNITGDVTSTGNIKAGANTYLTPTDIYQSGATLTSTYMPISSSINALNDVNTTTQLPTNGNTLLWNGSAWVPGVFTGGVDNIVYEEYIATASQTNFATVAGYDIGNVAVFVQGLRIPETDFTANDGINIIFTVGLNLNDKVTFNLLRYTNFADIYTKTEVDTLNLNVVKAPSGILPVLNGSNLTGVVYTGIIDNLSDVDTVSVAPIIGNTLTWNGTNWVPGDSSADALAFSIALG